MGDHLWGRLVEEGGISEKGEGKGEEFFSPHGGPSAPLSVVFHVKQN